MVSGMCRNYDNEHVGLNERKLKIQAFIFHSRKYSDRSRFHFKPISSSATPGGIWLDNLDSPSLIFVFTIT